MRSIFICVAMAVLCTPFVRPQDQSMRLGDFAGTWKAEFQKQTWMVLTLTAAKGSLSGDLSHSVQISADDKGEITSAGDEMSTGKLVSAELRGTTLHLTVRDEEGSSEEYSLILTGPDTADLHTETSAPGAPKPFHLKRTTPANK